MNGSKHSIKRSDIFLLVFLAIIVIITIFSALNPNFGEFFSIKNWFNLEGLNEVPFLTAIIFTMIICFLGALVPFPVPYPAPITLFSAIWFYLYGIAGLFFVIILILLATLAVTIGDLIDYLIGDGTERVLSKDDPELQNRWSQIILKKPKAIPWIIVLFGVTPLPDSVLLVPLGIVRYDLKKTLIFMYVGRFFMMLIYSLIGILAINWVFSEGSSPLGWIYGVALLYIIWGMIVVMFKFRPGEKNK